MGPRGDFTRGVTPENVPDYLPWADCQPVAGGVSTTFDELDPDRVRDPDWVVRSWPHRGA